MCTRIRIADHVIELATLYVDVELLCKDYLTMDEPELYIQMTPEDISYERQRYEASVQESGTSVRAYSDGYFETLAVYRKIAERLLWEDILLIHGSALAVDGCAYLFTAESGAGKSTHAKLWRDYLGDRVQMINDDKPLIRVSDSIMAYGTPWDGKHRLSSNTAVPLSAVAFIEQSRENQIERMSGIEVWPDILRQIYRPKSAEAVRKVLQLTDVLLHEVRFYRIRCNRQIDAAILAYRKMRE